MCAVEWKKLGDVCKILDSQRKPISKSKRVFGSYPYYGANGIQDYVDGYIFDGTYLLIGEDGSVINKDNSPVLHWVSGQFWVNNHAHILSDIKDAAILKYLYYVLHTIDVSDIVRGVPPKLNQENLKNIILPIPSLAKQQEIVSHLDTFTTLISNLESELDMRRKQYEHYRNQLLDFEGVKGVEWKTLGEVAPYRKSRIEYSLLNTHNYVSVENLLQMKKGKTDAEKVPSEGNAIKYETGDILVGNIRPYLKKIWMAEYVGGTNGDVLVFGIKDKNILISKYLFYLLSSDAFFEYDNQHAKGGKMPRGDKSMIEKYLIPIPSPKAQQEIVEKLDAFENLIQSLEQEIKLRKQQYEYYREKLLTFE